MKGSGAPLAWTPLPISNGDAGGGPFGGIHDAVRRRTARDRPARVFGRDRSGRRGAESRARRPHAFLIEKVARVTPANSGRSAGDIFPPVPLTWPHAQEADPCATPRAGSRQAAGRNRPDDRLDRRPSDGQWRGHRHPHLDRRRADGASGGAVSRLEGVTPAFPGSARWRSCGGISGPVLSHAQGEPRLS